MAAPGILNLANYPDLHAAAEWFSSQRHVPTDAYRASMADGLHAVPDSDDAHLTHGSVRFHEHLGYHQTGCFPHCAYKFDTWYNMVWMSKQLIPCPQSPHPLRPFSEIADAWAREMHASAEK